MICDDDERLARRITRDMGERERTLESVLKQYWLTVKPSYNSFIAPTMKYADLIIKGTEENK